MSYLNVMFKMSVIIIAVLMLWEKGVLENQEG